jgi:Cation transporter/ATPase, N-terminus
LSTTSLQVEVASSNLKGLSSEEASALLLQYGLNDPAPSKRGASVREVLVLFLNPLVIILLVATLASFILGDAADAIIILVLVLLGVSINFVQTCARKRLLIGFGRTLHLPQLFSAMARGARSCHTSADTTGLTVADFSLVVSLGLFNSALMNDAVYKFNRHEDASLNYTGINKHEGEDIGLYDTVITRKDAQEAFESIPAGAR